MCEESGYDSSGEEDPHSPLYAESQDLYTVISYITYHS